MVTLRYSAKQRFATKHERDDHATRRGLRKGPGKACLAPTAGTCSRNSLFLPALRLGVRHRFRLDGAAGQDGPGFGGITGPGAGAAKGLTRSGSGITVTLPGPGSGLSGNRGRCGILPA